MKILALVNEKGGSGKSTLSIHIATALHRRGVRVVLVDADEQGTARDWREASPEGADLPPVVSIDRPESLLQSIKAIAGDVVIIDTPARASKMSANVVRVSDVVLIPVQPSGPDVWASAAAVELINGKRDLGGVVQAFFVANRVNPKTKISKEIVAGEWNEYGVPILSASVSNRVAFAQSVSEGVTVFETKDTDAQAEINGIINEIAGVLK